jgi:DNA replication and repair protein RecF
VHRKISDLLGLLSVVNLSPEDVAVVAGAPRQRRRFLNYCICQISPSYWASLVEYQRIVQQRNMALRSRSGGRWRFADAGELEAWDEQLVATGSRIMLKRLEVLRNLDPRVNRYHQRVSDGGERLSLTYKPSYEIGAGEQIETQFKVSLKRQRDKECKFGMTLVGPHRDDISIFLNSMDLRTFGSQGQQRTAAIALKLAAARFLEETRGEQPILLLDDVFAELDGTRTRLLFDQLAQFKQLFIATAKESDLAGCGLNMRRLIIAEGVVSEAS